MATIVKTVKCPLCGWHWTLESKGSKRLQRGESADLPKGKFTFEKFDPKEEKLISIRECQGRGRGLPEINIVKLSDAMNDPEYKELIASLRNQCYSILKVILPE